MSIYDTFQKANNKGSDQYAQGHRLVCAFVVRTSQRWDPYGSGQGKSEHNQEMPQSQITEQCRAAEELAQSTVSHNALYTTLTNFSTKYLVMCKVYTDVGGIN